MKQLSLARKVKFRAAHLYQVSEWSQADNDRVFGACHTPFGHGHSYELEVFVKGPIDPITGMIVNLVDVDQWLQQVVADVHDKHLNFEIEEFQTKVPTTENLAEYFWSKLQPLVEADPKLRLEKLRLYESPNLWVELEGESD